MAGPSISLSGPSRAFIQPQRGIHSLLTGLRDTQYINTSPALPVWVFPISKIEGPYVQLSNSVRTVSVFWSIIFILGLGGVAVAQSTGSIQGVVRDSSGASIEHAQINITDAETGLVRRSDSDPTRSEEHTS